MTPAVRIDTTFTDRTGAVHDLLNEPLLSVGEVALRLRRSKRWVRARVRSGELRPVIHGNKRDLQIFACALTDYRARQLEKQSTRNQ